MYDKAHERFRQLGLEEKHDFYLKLINHYNLDDLKSKFVILKNDKNKLNSS